MEYIWQSINQFAVSHDTRKIFLIIYIGGAAVIALVCGLFYFALWVIAHFLLELYKYYRLSSKIKLKDILASFYHCKVDIMFLAIGLCVDVISHHSFALAIANKEIRLFRVFKFSQIESLGRIAKVAKILPRFFGTIKASNCVLHLSSELSNQDGHKSEENIHWKMSDTIIAMITLASLILTFSIPVSMGVPLSETMHSVLHILSP